MDLTQLGQGRRARIVELLGGRSVNARFGSMGIRPGRTVRKRSAALLKGPVVLEVGSTQLAIGHGMAQKIIVEPVE